MINTENFGEKVHEQVKVLASMLLHKGYCLTLVGGLVRDFALTGHTGKDYDFEISWYEQTSEKQWLDNLQQLVSDLRQAGYDAEKMEGFHVIKVALEDGLSCEFAPARQEFFKDENKSLGHGDVSLKFLSFVDCHKVSFARRDFTCNAMGVVFSLSDQCIVYRFIDPFCGFKAIQNKVLIPCGDNFIYDPVRFLRACRFSHLLSFDFSLELQEKMTMMNLEQISSHYFIYESMKVSFFDFCRSFFEQVQVCGTKLPKRIKNLDFLGKLGAEVRTIDKEEIFTQLYRQNIEKEKIEMVREVMGVKKSLLKKVAKIASRRD